MENKISFAEFIKNEIIDSNWEDRQLGILFYSFLRTNGVFRKDKFVVGTSLILKKEFFLKQFKKYYELVPDIIELETKTNFVISDKEFIDKYYKQERELSLETDEDRMAYVAGAFIGKGWVSRPSSRSYHMEFRIGAMDHSLNLQESIDSLGVKTTTVTKGRWLVTYIKRSISLADLLRAMKAPQSMMAFEEERISRDFVSSLSKMESIEEYNLEKTIRISRKQINAIEKLSKSDIWKTIKSDLRNIAEIRKDKPNYSLADLQYTFNSKHEKDVSKSTINNWLKTLVEMSDLI